MKRYENGKYIEMTAEEVSALQQQAPQPTNETLEERLAMLEALLAERGGA